MGEGFQMQRADTDFCRGLALLLAAKRIEELTDDYARERLQALAEDYRARANALMAGCVGHELTPAGKFSGT